MGESDYRERNIEECGYPYKFSIVMAVYNVEEYIREAIDSIIKQNIGFEKNVQLILVDDGSPDGSGAICDEYQENYPENIKVIHKENGGVSSARNEGLKYIEGRYVNFLDPDDKLSLNTLQRVYNFFSKNEKYIDVVAIPIYLFEAQRGEHILNGKFKKGTRIINLKTEYESVLLSAASSFFTHEAANKIGFDTQLSNAEDAKEILKILLDKFSYGVVHNVRYEYRKRNSTNLSALQTAAQQKEWYIDKLKRFSLWAFEFSWQKYGYIPNFVQFTIMYDLQWKISPKEYPNDILTGEEIIEYQDLLRKVLQYISDEIILKQRQLWADYKLRALSLKYQCEPSYMLLPNDLLLSVQNANVLWISNIPVYIDFIHIDKQKITIEGHYNTICVLPDETELVLQINGVIHYCTPVNRDNNHMILSCRIVKQKGFVIEVPLDTDIEKYQFLFFNQYQEHLIRKKKILFGRFSPVSTEYKNAYYWKDGWLLLATGNSLNLRRCGRRERLKREKAFLKELRTSKKESDQKAAKARVAYWLLKPLLKKPIWLVSDRIIKADDNGEAFFRYLNEHHAKDVTSYFVLGKDSPDFERISKIGKVVENLSWKHKLLFLFCDYNISSQADGTTDNPFQRFYEPYRDLMVKHGFVFLQHGVTKDDISDWVNRYNKNFALFVAAAIPEAESLCTESYHYQKEVIQLSGFPRFDRLYHDEQRMITIMPTWRKYLTDGLDSARGVWKMGQRFLESEYYQFCTKLLNSERLLEAAKRNQYQVAFMPHPTIQPHLELFDISKEVKICGVETSYREIYAQSDLLITDYSSAVFDFAYLRKPVLYAHFDKETFFAGNHIGMQGYFDYERDGFGEVEYDLESTIDRIIEYMENGCQLKEKYRERIDNFFAYNDQNNCERVYKAILNIEKE